MHPRLTALDLVFPEGTPIAARVSGFARAGIDRVGLLDDRLETGAEDILIDSGLDVTHVYIGPLFTLTDASAWSNETAAAQLRLDRAKRLGARCVYSTTGAGAGLTWEDAAAAFSAAVEPLVSHAQHVDIPVLVESATTLAADRTFVHTLRDLVELARLSGVRLCLDVQSCWEERHLRETIYECVDLIDLVQLNDQILGRREVYPTVPGDGAIPLERIVGDILEAGYGGYFDLEVYPEPGVDPELTLARACDYTSALLDRLGA